MVGMRVHTMRQPDEKPAMHCSYNSSRSYHEQQQEYRYLPGEAAGRDEAGSDKDHDHPQHPGQRTGRNPPACVWRIVSQRQPLRKTQG